MLNFSGKKIGMLTVLEAIGSDKNNHMLWRCECECGKEVVRSSCSLKADRKKPHNCGCLRNNHFITHGSCGERLYKLYKGILQRCNNPNHKMYHRYGGRGIQVCDEWLNFPEFKEWALKNGYSDELTIERINKDLNYSPENCEWITKGENSRRANTKYSDELKQEIRESWLKFSGNKKQFASLYPNLTYNAIRGILRN